MTTTYLRFPDEATGMVALYDAGLLDSYTSEVITASHTHAIDVIGPISIGGTYDPDTGDIITPPTLLPGWHVNFIGELPEEWEQYVVMPEQPVRIFAV